MYFTRPASLEFPSFLLASQRSTPIHGWPRVEGSYARHYTTNACGGCWLARSVRMLEAHESLTGLEELKRSLFGPGTKDQGLDPVTYEKALSFHAG